MLAVVWTTLTFTILGQLLLLGQPTLIAEGYAAAGPLVKAAVHTFTLGALLSGAYGLLHRTWARLYSAQAPWRPLVVVAFVLHVPGVALLLWGFVQPSTLAAYWGGHYLVPTGALLLVIHGVVAVLRRPAGTPRNLWSLLPALGLFVAIIFGALLVMEWHRPTYGLYAQPVILVHLLAGGFLFLLPLLCFDDTWLAAERDLQAEPRPDDAALPGLELSLHELLRVVLPTLAGGAGVLAVAFATSDPDGAGAYGLGLALLGATGLWLGLPLPLREPLATLDSLRRIGWVAVGLVALFAAIRTLRGLAPGEAVALATLGVVTFVFALALPDVLARLGLALGQPRTLTERSYRVYLLGSALLVAGNLTGHYSHDAVWLVRAGGLAWVFGLAGPLLYAAARTRRPSRD